MDVYAVCPLLLPQNREATVYDGFITVAGVNYQVHIELRERGQLEGARLDCGWRMKQLLHGYVNILQQRLQQCSSLAEFLVELKSILERQLEGVRRMDSQPPPKFYTQLIQEIEQLGWHRLSYIDTSFQQLHLVANDDNNRQHTLKLQLHIQHPAQSPECFTELPQAFQFGWSPQSGVREVYEQFRTSLQLYQSFWDAMDELDTNTWILEPEKPTRNATYRRIALGSNASLQCDVDWRQPRQLPECRFLGADHVINPLRENLNKNLHKWSVEQSLLENLQAVLEMTFPSPSHTKKEDFSMECGICYAYRLEGQIPEQVCEDSRCGQPFHQTCLYEWLRALASSRQSFNLVFGECPYCSKPITVKMPVR